MSDRGWIARAPLCALLVAATANAAPPDPGAPIEQPADPGVAPVAPVAAPTPPPIARLRGRVFERGSIAPVAGATVTGPEGAVATTDEKGDFELDLPPGKVDVEIAEDRHEPLRVTETLRAGEGLTVEYSLLARPSFRRKFETTVRGEARHEGQRFALRAEELHQTPGTLGDPYRAIALMPGVATPIPLLPLYVIRGASPGMNGFFLDGMRVPQLFHFLVGGGVVNARLVDRLDFYPGAYDASFGRFAGGIIDSETRPARDDASHGEVELRLYEVSTLGEAKLPHDVRIALGGHYGFPGPLISIAQPGVDASYWDYQFRLDWHGLTVEALGSFDSLTLAAGIINQGTLSRVSDDLMIAFHRIQVRDRYKKGRFEVEAALYGGLDQMTVFGGFGVQKLALGVRANLRVRLPRLTIYGGVDGELSRFTPANFVVPGMNGGAAPDELGELSGNRDGIVGSAFLEGIVDVIPRRLTVTAGARVDVYHSSPVTLVGIDPRVTARAHLMKGLDLVAGGGMYQQPPAFPVALPGIDTFALQLGLQRAYQGSAGVEAKLPETISLTLTGFYQKFQNINDVVLDFGPQPCTSPPPESLTGALAIITRQLNGQAYGLELLLRRHEGRFTGWIAYTLSRSERYYSCGLRPADFDQTHVLNVVGQVRLPKGFSVGARLFVSTGRPFTQIDPASLSDPSYVPPRNNERFDTYVQIDLRADWEHFFRRWALSVFVELLNITYSQTVYGVSYPKDMLPDGTTLTRYDEPHPLGIRYVLPSVGIRGRF